ncbi:MAG: hypothetical protein HY904_09165 [Deltaproteobacteria bacterium]|nr:hypothetical protein [Deltaproteobacteria bacterium]
MRAIVLTGVLGVVVGLGVAEAAPPAKAKAPLAVRCFDLGAVFGQVYAGLDQRQRALSEVLVNYCSMKRDPSLARVPTDDDVQAIVRDITGQRDGMEQGAHIKTKGLERDMKQGREAESQMLDQLLK